jgi:hypothetical protein
MPTAQTPLQESPVRSLLGQPTTICARNSAKSRKFYPTVKIEASAIFTRKRYPTFIIQITYKFTYLECSFGLIRT